MKIIKDITISIFTLIFSISIVSSCNLNENEESELNHLVLVKWKDGAPLDSIKKDIYNSLATHKIADDFVYTENVWPNREVAKEFSKGFTHLWYVNFESEDDRDSIYLTSDEEKFFIGKYRDQIEDIAVFDWWSED
tara:strand:- start:320 stop:727 length:408 start_codon:yes stop_codon:yes gene_type:complete